MRVKAGGPLSGAVLSEAVVRTTTQERAMGDLIHPAQRVYVFFEAQVGS